MSLRTIGGKHIDMADTTYVDEKIKGKLTNVGSIPFEELPALSDELVGNVYNITNDFITTNDFIDGEGVYYHAGSDVVIVNIGESLVYDVMGSNDEYDIATAEEIQDMLGGLYKD